MKQIFFWDNKKYNKTKRENYGLEYIGGFPQRNPEAETPGLLFGKS